MRDHNDPRMLLIVSGGIAAYKSLELVRRARERGLSVGCVVTAAGARFVTPLSLEVVSGESVYSDLFELTETHEMGHIELARGSDIILVAPATANLMAKVAGGIADDLASTLLIATDKPVLMAPAMNVEMWKHPAVQRVFEQLKVDGVHFVGPESGNLACGDVGLGRMAEPSTILKAMDDIFLVNRPLEGRKALVTSGPTREPLDPVRFLSNRSSGKQGHAIALALSRLGAETTLVTGPTDEPDPQSVRAVHIETAAEMMAACESALPTDVAVCAAAVSDWKSVETSSKKIKKTNRVPEIDLVENIDILSNLAQRSHGRPHLVIGFSAETDNLLSEARAKRLRKGCDWILANDVASGDVFGSDDNTVHFVTADSDELWPRMTKTSVAERLADRVSNALLQLPR